MRCIREDVCATCGTEFNLVTDNLAPQYKLCKDCRKALYVIKGNVMIAENILHYLDYARGDKLDQADVEPPEMTKEAFIETQKQRGLWY